MSNQNDCVLYVIPFLCFRTRRVSLTMGMILKTAAPVMMHMGWITNKGGMCLTGT